MAMSQPEPGRGQSKNLTCERCHDIFRYPKLLPCLHTLCFTCVEDLATAQGSASESFRCPVCQTSIQVPPEGVQSFANNVYITEEELERARTPTTRVSCPTHPEEALKYFCLECEKPTCLSCRLTKHFPHSSGDLSEAAARSKTRLAEAYRRLDQSIKGLARVSELQQNNLKVARQKADTLRGEVHAHHHALVTKATALRDKVLEGLTDVTEDIDRELTTDLQKVQEALESLVELQQRVQRSLDNPKDAEVVALEKEVSEGKGNAAELAKVDALYKPRRTPRPGLHSYARNLKESLERDVLLYLGSPVKLVVPYKETSDIITPFYCCETDEACREVHALYRTDDGTLHIAFGGKPPMYTDEMIVHLDQSGVKTKQFSLGRKISFDKSCRVSTYAPLPADGCEEIQANSNGDFYIKTCLLGSRKTTIESKHPKESRSVANARTVSFEINNASKPRSFDANASGELFVVVNEEKVTAERSDEAEGKFHFFRKSARTNSMKRAMKTHSVETNLSITNAQVRLYRKHLSDPVATYISPLQHFFPTAVSFWQVEQQELLLVADWLNDSIHVVRVENGEFRFVRFLHAAGYGDLVRPTALDVDKDGNVWIGCETGWVLRFQSLDADSVLEDAEPVRVEDIDSLPFLQIENRSRTPTLDTNNDSLI